MNKKIAASFVVLTVLSQLVVLPSAYAAETPEEKCFNLLAQRAKNNPAFSDVDLSKVKKFNGKNNAIKSQAFSVNSYSDFLATFQNYIPTLASDIIHYPNTMNLVANAYKFKREIHKANRNNSAAVLYNDGTKTNISQFVRKDGTDYQQQIDGHYVNTKYVTFGRQSRLAFSFPSRDPNPGEKNFFPSGRKVKDMREYVMYTHHLTPKNGSKFMSCNLLKMVPQGQFKLQDYLPTDKAIVWENYGGTRMSESNVSTKVVGDGEFRRGEIEYTITDSNNPNKRLLRFYVLSIVYDNGSSFMNPFETLNMFDSAMKNAHNTSKNFLEMRRAYYQRIIDSGMGIGSGASTYDPTASNDEPEPPANANWVLCAQEDQTCTFNGTSDVRYGQNNAYNYKRITDSTLCNNSIFGDPLIGTGKSCWYDSNQASAAATSLFNWGGNMGSSVICTHYNKKGLLSDDLYATEMEYGKSVDPRLYAGYLVWAKPFVAWLEQNEWADVVVAPLVNAWAKEVAFKMGERTEGNWVGRKMSRFGEPITFVIGHTLLAKKNQQTADYMPTFLPF